MGRIFHMYNRLRRNSNMISLQFCSDVHLVEFFLDLDIFSIAIYNSYLLYSYLNSYLAIFVEASWIKHSIYCERSHREAK